VKNDPFVHDVTIGTESMQYLLTSEKQLSDIEQFCEELHRHRFRSPELILNSDSSAVTD
jgi:hypothetical protein